MKTPRLTRRALLGSVAATALAQTSGETRSASGGSGRTWPLGINTYCLRFQRWNDRQLVDYCVQEKLDAIFLQDSIDPGTMDPKHWAEVRQWVREAGLAIETGGGSILPKSRGEVPQAIATLARNVERAKAMGSPLVRANLGPDRYGLPEGPMEQHIETTVQVLRGVRQQALDGGLKIAIENHKEMPSYRLRSMIDQAGTDFVGSYLDTGNPVFVAEDPLTAVEELGPVAVTFHLRDSVVYQYPDGIAVQWVPLGQGTVDFRALVARAATILPPKLNIYCKPITARPPVVLPVYTDEFWTKWFTRSRSQDLARFLALARRGKPWDQPHLTADLPQVRDRYLEALKVQQMDHMRISLDYCRNVLHLGVRARG